MFKTNEIFDKCEDEIARFQYKNFNPLQLKTLRLKIRKQYLNLILKIISLTKIFNTILLANLAQQMLQNLTLTKIIILK